MTARLSRDTLLLLISNLGSAGLLFALSAIIGRALGSQGLGTYAVALAWVYPLSLLVEFGLGTLLTRDIAQQPEQTRSYVTTVVFARLLMGGLAMLLLLLAAPMLSSDPLTVTAVQVSAPLVILLPLFSTFTAVFRARGMMAAIPALNIGMLVVQVALTMWVVLGGGSVIDVLLVNTIMSAGQAAAAWWVYRWYFVQHRDRNGNVAATHMQTASLPSRLRTKILDKTASLLSLLGRAFPFALAALFAALQMRLSLVLLERLASPAEAGYFSAASRFVEAARLFPNAFFGALFPALSMLAADRHRMTQTFSRATWALALFGVAAGAAFTLAASPLLELVFGAEFRPAVPTLIILGWSLVFGILRGVRTLYWYALGREQYVNFINGAVIVIQGALGIWLVPRYGALGAALSFVVVEAAALALLWREIRFPRINKRRANRKDTKNAKEIITN